MLTLILAFLGCVLMGLSIYFFFEGSFNANEKIERAEKEKIRKEFEARRNIELSKSTKLFSDAEKFDKATLYRNFIEATEQKAIKENNEAIIKEIEEMSDFADSSDTFKKRIINLIKNR